MINRGIALEPRCDVILYAVMPASFGEQLEDDTDAEYMNLLGKTLPTKPRLRLRPILG